MVTWLAGFSNVASPPIIRGTHIGSYEEAITRAANALLRVKLAIHTRMLDHGLRPDSLSDIQVATFPWGGVDLPFTFMDAHTLILGTTAAGKTLLIRQLLQPALCPLGNFRHSAIVYDAKREYLPILAGMGIPREKLLIVNPGDARAVAWNLAADIKTRDDAVNIAHTLIPEEPSSNENPFFSRAVRAIVAEVFMCLHSLSPGTWRLADATNALQTPETIAAVLKTTPEGDATYRRYFTQADETVGGVVSTIDARFLSEYETIARIWSRCERSFSLTEWINDTSILLLGFDANRVAVDRINQAIVQRASQLICALPEETDGNGKLRWFILDEPRFAGKLPGLPQLISFGRTKGARVVFSPQDIDGLYDAYGEHQANEILSLCGNIAVLRLQSPRTRDWAAKLFGDFEAWESDSSYSIGNTSGSSGNSSTQTWSWTRRRVKHESILPSEFFNFPPTSRENGLHGFFAIPQIGAWRAQIPATFIDGHLSPRDIETTPFEPRMDFAVDPQPWTKEEKEKFTTRKSKSAPKKPKDGGVSDSPDDKSPPTQKPDDPAPDDRLPKW